MITFFFVRSSGITWRTIEAASVVKGDRFADKAVYSITDKGKVYFGQLMEAYAGQKVPLLFDFNVGITN